MNNSFFEYLRNNPEAAARFDASMQAVSTYALEAGGAAELFDWSLNGRAKTVVDVGGGTGTLLAAILAKHPTLNGILFDQEHVLGRSAPVLDAAPDDVRARVDLAAGDFFDASAIPRDADVYVMKNIMHDWPDAEAAQILRAVQGAMKPDAVLVVLDMVRSDRLGHEPWVMDMSDYFDLNMLVTVGGKERSRSEWAELFKSVGMHMGEITTGRDRRISTIEARLVPSPAHATVV